MYRSLQFCLAVSLALGASVAMAQDDEPKKFGDFGKLVKGAKEIDGLFKLYQKDDHVYMEIQPHQFDKPLLAPAAVARGATYGGSTLNSDGEWVLMFRRVVDKIHLIRRNVRFKANPGTPVAKAVETTYTDSVLMALRIQAINPQRNAPLIDLNDIYFTDLTELNLGALDTNRTTWQKVKAFPKNLELQVAATFTSRGRMFSPTNGDASDSVIDPRGTTVVIHYSLMEMPEPGYSPRLADDRIGYFLTAVKDFSNDNRETSFVRYINRWRLERADGSTWKEGGKLVPPKKKIVYWIEKSVPDEYRTAVREGILEWNKAFEKVGFRDAIEVRQQESEDFDPEDVTYSTIRWTAHDEGYAIGPSRANPLTGEILDADILFDASMVRYYKLDQQLFKNAQGQWQEMPSPIEAARLGWNLPFARLPGSEVRQGGWNERSDPAEMLRDRCRALRLGLCQCGSHKRSELALAAAALLIRGKSGEKGVPDELIQQAVKETTMHEVGHTLGLRHNFKASTWLKNEQLQDVAFTRKNGLVGSIMDYNPVNLAPKGVKQGDYFSNTIGPYDYWAIDYGYRPLNGGTEGESEELQKIASKSAQSGLDYGTDEDLFGTADPLINQWDLGSDPMKFAQDRVRLADELIKGLADRVVEKGDGYQRARQAFSTMLRQYADAAALTSYYVGGEYYNRDHKGDADGRDPMVPVKAAKQREALAFLQQNILTDKPFSFPPELLRKMAADRWMHWGLETSMMTGVEFPLNERILSIQRVALNRLLAGGTLARIQNSACLADKGETPLTVAEVFRCLSDSIWSDLPTDKPAIDKSTVIRRNLQREHLKKMTALVLGQASLSGGLNELMAVMRHGASGTVPHDARSLARMHLKEIAKRIDKALADPKAIADDAARAHLDECKERISKTLSAAMQTE